MNKSSKQSPIRLCLASLALAMMASEAGCLASTEEPTTEKLDKAEHALSGGFVNSCDSGNLHLSGGGPDGSPNVLEANCDCGGWGWGCQAEHTGSGYAKWGKVWLPACLGNNDGVLTWQRDGYYD